MVAGINLKVRFWRFVDIDDDVGGNRPSGTVLYESIDGRIAPLSFHGMLPILSANPMGIEVVRTLSGLFWPGTLDLKENDEVEVTNPPNHRYYGQWFRIETVEYTGFHPAQKRDHLLCYLRKSDRAHTNAYQ